ncbi:MAG: riboflavin synthase [Planctomycetota bacterium]|jgi:riboflavin synthase
MFTGIIRHVGSVQSVSPVGNGRRLGIDLGPLAESAAPGDSVAVGGACLTVAELAGCVGQFDVVAETLSRTTLGKLVSGAKVNLELAMPLGGRLDGHLVQGHVDGIAEVAGIRRGDPWEVTFRGPTELTDGMIPKGSVAIDGVSLTLADLTDQTFRVALIPTTLAETTLADLAVGGRVNIETDVIGKYVQRYLQQLARDGGGSLTLEKLREAGFC